MQIHQIKPNTQRKKQKTVGRGGRRGKTSGRGHKGQRQHGGHGIRPQLRDIIKQFPKKRGYRFNSIHEKPTVVNLKTIDQIFTEGDTVSPRTLVEKYVIRKSGGKLPKIKILSEGEITKKVIIADCLLSKIAAEKIKKAGGIISE